MTPATPPTEASTVELARWAFERLNAHDVASLRQLWTSETVERFPNRTCRGADEIARYFEEALAAIPDFHMEVIAIAAQGDDVFVRWHLTGGGAGAVAVDGIDHFVVRDGKVVSNFVVFDQLQNAQ